MIIISIIILIIYIDGWMDKLSITSEEKKNQDKVYGEVPHD